MADKPLTQEHDQMLNYILRNIDPELWDRVKQRARGDNLPLRAIILALLRGYADGEYGVKVVRRESFKRKRESRDARQWREECERAAALPPGPHCTICAAKTVEAVGDACSDCLWGGKQRESFDQDSGRVSTEKCEYCGKPTDSPNFAYHICVEK